MRGPNCIEYNGKRLTMRAWASLWGVSYNAVKTRWRRGIRDKWALIGSPTPLPFPITDEQREWLRETHYARSGQKQRRGRLGRLDSEWEIACDLVGIPRIFENELKEALT